MLCWVINNILRNWFYFMHSEQTTLWKYIVRSIRYTNNGTSQWRATNGFQSLKWCVDQWEQISVCVKEKHHTMGNALERFLFTRCDAWKTNSFAALIRSLYIYNKLWLTIVHICDVNLFPPSLPDHNLTAGVFGPLNLNIKSPRDDGSFARFFLSCRPCCEYLN